ncbi:MULTISPECIES: hypothetical protein [Acidiphilium]|uniref:Trypsin-like peptidase domain-containing protein n=1 Tax=Acidiphilium rubrum TaxID=526 RepID=A0A8G2FHT2_ACIRU|nr:MULTISPECIES: hypothetical protein [Acidiphilium]SIR35630.1 hypothetical protein SAMN05421828_12614 [Acidiphilium rubrum]
MPRLTPRMLRCVFFLFGHTMDGQISKNPDGTGFLVGYHSRDQPHLWHVYAVSNQHVVVNAPMIRINTKDGGTRLLEYNPDQWTHSKTDDLAVIDVTDELSFNPETLEWSDDITWVHELDLLRYDEGGGRAYIGDQTIMVGLFADHMGPGTVNSPVARFGSLAAFAQDGVSVSIGSGDRFARPAFLNDTRSRTGFSGSPVWTWYNPDSDIRAWEDSKNPISSLFSRAKKAPDLCLIGVHRAQFREDAEVIAGSGNTSLKRGDVVKIASSMTIVVPSWEIKHLIETEVFELQRKKRDDHQDRKDASVLYQRLAQAQDTVPLPPSAGSAG